MCMIRRTLVFFFFFFNDTATTEIYTLSLHDALPICHSVSWVSLSLVRGVCRQMPGSRRSLPQALTCARRPNTSRSEEHTSELQSQSNLVCRLLLEKKKNIMTLILHSYPLESGTNHAI